MRPLSPKAEGGVYTLYYLALTLIRRSVKDTVSTPSGTPRTVHRELRCTEQSDDGFEETELVAVVVMDAFEVVETGCPITAIS